MTIKRARVSVATPIIHAVDHPIALGRPAIIGAGRAPTIGAKRLHRNLRPNARNVQEDEY